MSAQSDANKLIADWEERLLSREAEADSLPRAFRCEELLDQISEVIASGMHPVLMGDSGVGKTAAIYELVRRVDAGNGPPALAGGEIIQFSLRQRVAGLPNPDKLRIEFRKLLDALHETGDPVIPFFRDLDLAHDFNLAPMLQSLAYQIAGPILGEGTRSKIEAMFESNPELERDFVALNCEEPSPQKTEQILLDWRDEQICLGGRQFSDDALSEALHLSHRFLTRARLPRKALDLLNQTASLTQAEECVDSVNVIDRFCRTHKVPRFLVDPSVRMDLSEVASRFESSVLGQAEAVNAVVRMIGLIKAGLTDTRRPFGVFLFAGPTGVGKTHLAQMLAEYLFGSSERVIRFNMADHQCEHSAQVLFGDPDEYRLPQIRGQLTQRLLGHPFAVLLLDEFEKADSKVLDRFLQLIDEGSFINGAGETMSCRSTIIIATSNAGADVYRRQSLGFAGGQVSEELTLEVERQLEADFRFEFLNRFDEIVHFLPLGRGDIRKIAARELDQLQNRIGLKRNGITLDVDVSLLDWLTDHGYHADYGARFLRRTVERQVTTVVAERIVRDDPAPGSTICLSVRDGKVIADTAGRCRGISESARQESRVAPITTAEITTKATKKTAAV